ncbi:hypothetical protein AAEX28_13710 [Lentisphaerota bacterium WC36G]|nr:hypothetical protein LJT99_00465 [Lentisphaerae bacterium WC36]
MVNGKKLRQEFTIDIGAFTDNKLSFENFVLKYQDIEIETCILGNYIQDFFKFYL